MSGLIQVAGVIDGAEAQLLCEEGVDWLGLPLRLPSGDEDLGEAEAAAVVDQLRPPHEGVLITYVTDAAQIASFCAELGVRTVQLHGDVPLDELRALKAMDRRLRVIKSLVVRGDDLDELLKFARESAAWVDMFITDTFDPATGATGATGLTHDWSISAELVRRAPKPLMMAGGLTPDNVAEAIRVARPAAVDAHTGLEDTDGRKDRAKVRSFVMRARHAFAELDRPSHQRQV
ncbi:phosphoribosylanthranilate isomerase [Haloechinothrix sp. LS1_15]|uniref:phosphoribosylanthranilate isomerase n=1 Tax=Haloechinothrix sp. LS1_15 TaxID=2652248 RepID=UPI0029440DF5|nr:phosphoribosylanthranilate isomerase [Haloechinothrix sp. LS1_15]MDV6011865.1 phosphoribosylanthranilate isomerase [Haloechinothrix sp. LS1_15]